jgi:hypothetical protein
MTHSLAVVEAAAVFAAADFMAAACGPVAFTAVACAERIFGAAQFMPDASLAVAAIASPEERGLRIQ